MTEKTKSGDSQKILISIRSLRRASARDVISGIFNHLERTSDGVKRVSLLIHYDRARWALQTARLTKPAIGNHNKHTSARNGVKEFCIGKLPLKGNSAVQLQTLNSKPKNGC